METHIEEQTLDMFVTPMKHMHTEDMTDEDKENAPQHNTTATEAGLLAQDVGDLYDAGLTVELGCHVGFGKVFVDADHGLDDDSVEWGVGDDNFLHRLGWYRSSTSTSLGGLGQGRHGNV